MPAGRYKFFTERVEYLVKKPDYSWMIHYRREIRECNVLTSEQKLELLSRLEDMILTLRAYDEDGDLYFEWPGESHKDWLIKQEEAEE